MRWPLPSRRVRGRSRPAWCGSTPRPRAPRRRRTRGQPRPDRSPRGARSPPPAFLSCPGTASTFSLKKSSTAWASGTFGVAFCCCAVSKSQPRRLRHRRRHLPFGPHPLHDRDEAGDRAEGDQRQEQVRPSPPDARGPASATACAADTRPTAGRPRPPRCAGSVRRRGPIRWPSRIAAPGPSPAPSSRSSRARRAPASPAGPARSCAAPRSRPVASRDSESRALGRGGSSSRILRRTSEYAASRSLARSSGVLPVSSSYSSTPSE